MAQHHKGSRRLIQTRLPEEVAVELERRVEADNVRGGLSQYLADWICVHVGRTDLVREANRRYRHQGPPELPLAI